MESAQVAVLLPQEPPRMDHFPTHDDPELTIDPEVLEAAAVNTDEEKDQDLPSGPAIEPQLLSAAQPNSLAFSVAEPKSLAFQLPEEPRSPKSLVIRAPSMRSMKLPPGIIESMTSNSNTTSSDTKVTWVPMVETNIKQPMIRLKLYAKGDAGSDMLTLYHNAIKRELQDLYFMLACMSKREAKLEAQELSEFAVWFDVFTSFVKWYMAFADSDLFPFAQKILATTNNPNASKIKHGDEIQPKKALMESELVECVSFFKLNDIPTDGIMLIRLPENVEVVSQLIKHMDRFVEPLLDVLMFEEKELIPMVSTKISNAEKAHIELQTFHALHDLSVQGHMHFHIILRALKQLESDEAHKMRQRYLSAYTAFSMKNRKVNKEYEQSREIFRRKHSNCVHNSNYRWNGVSSDSAKFGLQEVGGRSANRGVSRENSRGDSRNMSRENSGMQTLLFRRKSSKGESNAGLPVSKQGSSSKLAKNRSFLDVFGKSESGTMETLQASGVSSAA